MSFEEVANRIEGHAEADHGDGASEADIVAAENTLGSFPTDYRLFLARFGQLSVGPLEVYGLGGDIPDYLNVIEMTITERRDAIGFPAKGIVIHNDGGGNLSYLDSFDTGSPVKIWYHDDPDDIEIVASSFSAWLDEQLDDA
jgi:hypothetical protein